MFHEYKRKHNQKINWIQLFLVFLSTVYVHSGELLFWKRTALRRSKPTPRKMDKNNENYRNHGDWASGGNSLPLVFVSSHCLLEKENGHEFQLLVKIRLTAANDSCFYDPLHAAWFLMACHSDYFTTVIESLAVRQVSWVWATSFEVLSRVRNLSVSNTWYISIPIQGVIDIICYQADHKSFPPHHLKNLLLPCAGNVHFRFDGIIYQ